MCLAGDAVSGAQRLLLENVLIFLLGIGLLPILAVAPTAASLRRLWPIGYLVGLATVGIVAATLAVLSVPFPPSVLVGVAGLVIAFGVRRIRRDSTAVRRTAPPVDRIVATAIAPLLVLLVALAVHSYAAKPLREWDGWAIWGMKAHALAVLGSSSHLVLSSNAYDFSHLEYPLLLPGLEALGIRSAGGYESRLVVLQCVLVGVAGLLAIWGLLRDMVRPVVLWPFLAAVGLAPTVFGQLASGYADMPMAFLLACGVLAAGRWLVEAERPWLVLATLFLAGAALVKDEGDLFVMATYVGLVVAAPGRRRSVLASAALVVCSLLPWRVFLAVNHFSTNDFQFSKSFDPSWVGARLDRAPTVAAALLRHSVDVHQYAILLPIGLVALGLGFVSRARPLATFGIIFALLSSAGLVWIFVISWIPVDLYLTQTEDRITAGVVLGCAVLAPLLLNEACMPPSAQTDAAGSVSSREDRLEPLARDT
jgi:hypothetical protein